MVVKKIDSSVTKATCLSIVLALGTHSLWSTALAKEPPKSRASAASKQDMFEYFSESFADLRILKYEVKDFPKLSLEKKKFIYFLAQAALAGRDILWDQNYKHNLTIRRTLEEIVKNYQGDRSTPAFKEFMVYVKRVWFSNGVHHHYAHDKFVPTFSQAYFRELVAASPSRSYPLNDQETMQELTNRLVPLLFDPTLDHKKVNLDSTRDMVQGSAVNFYEGVTQKEVEDYYASIKNPNDKEPVSHGLNSKLVKKDGRVVPQVYKVGGMYSEAITQIVYWLRKAAPLAESELQKKSLLKLIDYYTSGDLRLFDEYNILWVQDTLPDVDVINGFIEVYNDPMGNIGSWESIVSVRDLDATEKFGVLSQEAGWFEKHSPIASEHKRENVTGVSYKVINVVTEAGDSSPATPIGINLPNANWIRAKHGSKSVSLANIEQAYAEVGKTDGAVQEFFLPEQIKWIERYGSLASRLATGLHEVIGHASGKIMPDVGSPAETLKNYYSPLEEARADLVALYYIGDQHLVDIGLVDSTDIIKAEYIEYITNGLLRQLVRIDEGKDIQEAHMRNRQLIASWAYERGKSENVIERVQKKGKTYFLIHDYAKLRGYFGELLREVQRIKSEGDYEAGRNLIERYAVKVDPVLHKEVKTRWKKLNIAPYSGFLNPILTPKRNAQGDILDVELSYPKSFTSQMLYYAKHHSFLPNYN